MRSCCLCQGTACDSCRWVTENVTPGNQIRVRHEAPVVTDQLQSLLLHSLLVFACRLDPRVANLPLICVFALPISSLNPSCQLFHPIQCHSRFPRLPPFGRQMFLQLISQVLWLSEPQPSLRSYTFFCRMHQQSHPATPGACRHPRAWVSYSVCEDSATRVARKVLQEAGRHSTRRSLVINVCSSSLTESGIQALVSKSSRVIKIVNIFLNLNRHFEAVVSRE